MFRVSKVLDDILVSFAPLPSLFEDQGPIGKILEDFKTSIGRRLPSRPLFLWIWDELCHCIFPLIVFVTCGSCVVTLVDV